MLINDTFISSIDGVKQISYKTITAADPVNQYTTSDKIKIADSLRRGTGTHIIPQLNVICNSWPIAINQDYIADKTRYNVFSDAYAYYVYARVIDVSREFVDESYIDTIKIELLTGANKARGITVTVKSQTTDIVYWDNLRKVDQDYIDSYDWFLIFYDDLTDKYRWPIYMKTSDTAFTRLRVDGNNERTQNQVIVQTTAYGSLTDYQAGTVYPDSDHISVPLYKSRVTNMNSVESQIKDNSDRLNLILSDRSSLFVSR